MKPLPLKQIAALLGFSLDHTIPISQFSVDSRLVNPGDLFFALKGARTDGHDFLQEAAFKGAAGAVVSKSYKGNSYGLPLIPVDDPLKSLQEFASHRIEQQNPIVVAVTGSFGKTTTKDFITSLLKTKYRVLSTLGNSNSQIGLPLSILNQMIGDEEVLVVEMGMTHPGQISQLVKLVPPDIAVITSVGLVHACNFDSIEEIALAKAEILSHPKTRLGILSYELDNFEALSKVGSCLKRTFSTLNSLADYYLLANDAKMEIATPMGEAQLKMLAVPGEHNRHNFLAALAVARELDVNWQEIAAGMETLTLPERRLQRVEKKGVVFINDSYNANAISMKAALNSLPEPEKGGKKIAVLGEMLELGKFSAGCHREVAMEALKYVDVILCLGQECKEIWNVWQSCGRPVEWHMERAALVESLRRIVHDGDVILLKGSRAKGLWNVIDEL